MGNPFLKQPRDAACKTRFKMWWRLVGSAVEHAAELFEPDSPVDFQNLFLAQDDEDEDSTSLAEALEIMLMKWMGAFDAADVAKAINGQPQDRSSPDQYGAPSTPDPNAASLREFLFPTAPLSQLANPKSIGRRLRNHVDEPVRSRGRTLVLRKQDDLHIKQAKYFVEVRVE